MEWTEKSPKTGDIIRRKVSFYYHYGIFVSESRVIQFGLPDNVNRPANEVKVIETDIYEFLGNGNLETAVFSRFERKNMRSAEETVKIAESRLGEGGYNVFNNNCEHFVYACAFSKNPPLLFNPFKNQT